MRFALLELKVAVAMMVRHMVSLPSTSVTTTTTSITITTDTSITITNAITITTTITITITNAMTITILRLGTWSSCQAARRSNLSNWTPLTAWPGSREVCGPKSRKEIL